MWRSPVQSLPFEIEFPGMNGQFLHKGAATFDPMTLISNTFILNTKINMSSIMYFLLILYCTQKVGAQA